jgi:hypothetical protein
VPDKVISFKNLLLRNSFGTTPKIREAIGCICLFNKTTPFDDAFNREPPIRFKGNVAFRT